MRPIDADELKKSLDISPDEWAKGRTIEHIINEAPTLDYAPVRHGKWIKDKDDLYWGNHFIHLNCSLCGGEAHINRFGTAYILSNYCPNCGAKMDGGKNDV